MLKNKVKILDCTLRDGGYVNDWQFGFREAKAIAETISTSGVEYVEVGFVGDYVNKDGHVRFDSMKSLANVFLPTNAKFSAMVYAEGYPVDKFPQRSKDTVDMVRVIFWKRNLEEGVEYVRQLVQKGYEVGVQLARTEQYDLDEIGDIVVMFNDIHPTAVYLVDSFGTFDFEKMFRYAEIYDRVLADDIHLGFHAHNNMQQAFTNSVMLIEHGWKHDLMIDASVLGMGRGAGNLNIELILHYLNSKGETYNLQPIVDVANDYIAPYLEQFNWGYSMPYFLSAINGRNPAYVNYMQEKGLSIRQIRTVYEQMRKDDTGIRYDEGLCDKYFTER